jgi:hypothetical protein
LLTPKFTFSPLASDVHVNAEIETDFATDLVLAERSDQLDQTNDEQFVCDNEHYGQDGDAHCCSMFLIGLQIRVWIPLKRLRRNMSSKCRRVAASVEWHRVALAVIFCNFVALLMQVCLPFVSELSNSFFLVLMAFGFLQYYKAPPAYANVLDQLNRAFTFFFCLELFVLVFALSPSVYIKRWSNIWDFGIVITSLIELVLDAQYVGAISSFRALRLFRLVYALEHSKRDCFFVFYAENFLFLISENCCEAGPHLLTWSRRSNLVCKICRTFSSFCFSTCSCHRWLRWICFEAKWSTKA